ncbi:SDG40 [Scenedesmus sp. PABB004]|nr:SDG40 [Scenedesmus sp. PABB004]
MMMLRGGARQLLRGGGAPPAGRRGRPRLAARSAPQPQKMQQQPGRQQTRQSAPAAAAGAAAAADALPVEGGVLEDLLVWLVANGVEGVGRDDSRVALYEEDASGERGVVAVEHLAPGDVLARVPLRLAITDAMDAQQRRQLPGEGELWQDRLVAALLQQVAAGAASPWAPYVRALPRAVPSALESFSPAEAAALQLPGAVAALAAHAARLEASWRACPPDAIGGADLATFRWAHSVVMSRTFGNAGRGGGVGVRLLCPLIDMLNHAGDETPSGLLGDEPLPRDNVRWDVVAPERSASGGWEMVLSATRAVAPEEPLLLSYFEGASEEFLLHYGFVPPANPHDTLALADSVRAGLEHLWAEAIDAGGDASALAGRYRAALDAGLAALQEEVAAAAAGSSDDAAAWGALLDALEPVKVASGSRVSGPFIAALEVLHDGDMAAVSAAVARLAWAGLAALPTPLLADLALLASDAQHSHDAAATRRCAALLRHYLRAVPDYAPEMAAQLADAAAAAAAAPGAGDGSTAGAAGGGQVLAAAKKSKRVPGPPRPAAAAGGAAGAAAGAARALDVDSLPLQVAVDVLLASIGRQPGVLRHAERLAVQFRASKKQLLMDVVLAAGVPLAQLQGGAPPPSLQPAAGGAAGASPSRHAPPWAAAAE